MRYFVVFSSVLLFLAVVDQLPADNVNHRLIILADMGNEPDEEQQMTHMLVNCNEFDLKGLIAVTVRPTPTAVPATDAAAGQAGLGRTSGCPIQHVP